MVFTAEAIVLRLFLASFLGALVGLEREAKERGAGLQTYALVSLGACLFALAGLALPRVACEARACEGFVVDVSRIIQAVALGIGFIGAGTIFKGDFRIEGITTAAGLWLIAGVGLLCGLGLLVLAGSFTAFSLLILVAMGALERKYFED